MNTCKYYYLENKLQLRPILTLDKEEKNADGDVISCFFKIKNFSGKKFVFGDFLQAPSGELFREGLADIIKKTVPENVKFIPAKIIDPAENVMEDYILIKTYNIYEAMDKERSEFEYDDQVEEEGVVDPNRIYQLYFDVNILNDIPLKNRLIFRLDESWKVYYHQLIVDAIKKDYPESNILFTDSETYNG